MTAVAAITCVILVVVQFDKTASRSPDVASNGGNEEVVILDGSKPLDSTSKPSTGKDGPGRVGFQNKKGEAQKLKWVGKEFENDVIYIYVEIPFEDAPEGMKLQNTMFFESFPEQTNLVIAHFGEKKINLLYKAGDKFKEL